MDELDAIGSAALLGPARVVSSLAFALAARHARRRADAPADLGGHGSDAGLDRVRLKYVESCGDVAWYLNSVQAWPESAGPRPTLLVLDDVAELCATGAPSLEADAPLARLLLLAKLASSAAAWLGCDCVVACGGAPPAARVVLRRHFPDARVVEPRDGGDFVVRGDGRRDLALRVTATQIRVS